MSNMSNMRRQISKKLNEKGGVGLVMSAAEIGIGAMSFKDSREEGKGIIESGLIAATETIAASITNPVVYFGGDMVIEGIKKLPEISSELMKRTEQLNRMGTASPFSTSMFIETRETYTMRQAAMAAIGQARGNLENAMIGTEANRFHR